MGKVVVLPTARRVPDMWDQLAVQLDNVRKSCEELQEVLNQWKVHDIPEVPKGLGKTP